MSHLLFDVCCSWVLPCSLWCDLSLACYTRHQNVSRTSQQGARLVERQVDKPSLQIALDISHYFLLQCHVNLITHPHRGPRTVTKGR